MKNRLNESYENYLKTIYILSKRSKGGWVSNTNISKYLQVKPSSVTDMLYKLNKRGLVSWKPRQKIRLTPKGRGIAKNTLESYENLKIFFKEILKLEDNAFLDTLCCKIEHFITPDIAGALKDLI